MDTPISAAQYRAFQREYDIIVRTEQILSVTPCDTPAFAVINGETAFQPIRWREDERTPQERTEDNYYILNRRTGRMYHIHDDEDIRLFIHRHLPERKK